MSGEHLVQEDPHLGVLVFLRSARLKADPVNAWRVLVDWGTDGDPVKAFELLAIEAGGDEARAILRENNIPIPGED